MKTKKVRCLCKSAFQDTLYGANIRIANETKQAKKEQEWQWRCTVCLSLHDKAF